ncbi:MAG: LacI family DNA-binding transcriptional regulator, partial [Draconibacterium sp.]|nr:LacI family DNA-binding transcriptional regulator [Draconibacterium sp.]
MSKRHISLKDLAKELGVSISTVSRALKNHPDISPEMTKKIQTKIDINAPFDHVWNILCNTENYSSWNPFMAIKGRFELNKKIDITIKLSPKKVFKFQPVITIFEKGHVEWKGKFLFPGLLD